MKTKLLLALAMIISCLGLAAQNVQEKLNRGETPYQIYYNNKGLLDSLYGKNYGGGLIFYLDTINGSALISAAADQSANAIWGCYSTWMNTSNALFAGFQNTAMLKGCGGSAATICDTLLLNGYNDWYLPSKDECAMMYKNLKQKGYGNFDFSTWGVNYWTSSQGVGSSLSLSMRFWDGLFTDYTRPSGFRVRAIRKSTVMIFKGLVSGTVGSFSEEGFTLATRFNNNIPFGNIYSGNQGLSAPAEGVYPTRSDVGMYVSQNDGSSFGVASVVIRTLSRIVEDQNILILGLLSNGQYAQFRAVVPKGVTYYKFILPPSFGSIRSLQWTPGLTVYSKIELMQ